MDVRLNRVRDASRRDFLRAGMAGMAAFLLPACGGGGGGGGGAAGVLPGLPTPGGLPSNIANLGPLQAANADGLMLPPGFTSRIVARSLQAPTPGATPWHSAPDGGACFALSDGGWVYVSNSEQSPGGGANSLRFDADGNIVGCTTILSGTLQNCAGGRTPWGTWLSCEESGDTGRVWECDPTGVAPAVARFAMGRFSHEATAFNAVDGCFYLTEDRTDGRLYRFTPSTPGNLATGALHVALVVGGLEGPVLWLPVPDPTAGIGPTRWQVPTSTGFNGGEGIACSTEKVVFATKGDGRLWSFDVTTQEIVVMYDDGWQSGPILTGVDNVVITPDGDVLVSEDGGNMQIVALPPGGGILPVVQIVGHSGSEVTGPAFDPSRTRLYFSSQRGTTNSAGAGMTFEVTGPFVA